LGHWCTQLVVTLSVCTNTVRKLLGAYVLQHWCTQVVVKLRVCGTRGVWAQRSLCSSPHCPLCCLLLCRSSATMATGATVLPINPTPGTWRRLSTKTTWPPQRSLPAPAQLGGDAPTGQQRQVYLVTLPFPRQQRAGLSGPRVIVPIAFRALCFACHRCVP
jgi:hypothetical protein